MFYVLSYSPAFFLRDFELLRWREVLSVSSAPEDLVASIKAVGLPDSQKSLLRKHSGCNVHLHSLRNRGQCHKKHQNMMEKKVIVSLKVCWYLDLTVSKTICIDRSTGKHTRSKILLNIIYHS